MRGFYAFPFYVKRCIYHLPNNSKVGEHMLERGEPRYSVQEQVLGNFSQERKTEAVE